MSGEGGRVEALRAAFDWEAIAHDLAHLPVIWDVDAADVLGVDQAWRGATPDEANRIVQVITAHYRGET